MATDYVTGMPETDLEKEIRTNLKDAREHQKDWRDEARDAFEFYAGRQYSDDERAELEEAVRPAITFNRIGPVIDAVDGHQRNSQQDIKYLPREQGDTQVNELLTGAARWADDESDALDEIAEAFLDCVICGMGWTESYMDYSEDPEGMLKSAEHVPVLEMNWDPKAKKRNLADARWVSRSRWWKRREAENRWPEVKDIISAESSEIWPDEIVGNEHDAQEAWKYDTDYGHFYNPHKDEVLIRQYQWWEHKKIYRVVDRNNNKIVELSPSKFEKLRDSLDMMGWPYVQQMKRTYFQAFLADDIMLEKRELPFNSFTLLCITGKRDNNKLWWFGLVRGMMDPQRWSNKFFAEIQDFMAANRRGGAFVETDALEDPRNAEENWNRPDALIMVRPGSISQGKILERQPPAYPAGLDRLMELAISAIPDTSGINMELMGLVDRNQPGVLEAQRKRAAMTILSGMFQALKYYQRRRGRLIMYFVREYLSDGRLIRIMGQDGREQFIPLVREEMTAKYDVIVDQAPHSPNQREETFLILMELVPIMAKLGFPPPPSLLDHIPIPSTLIQEWKEFLQQLQQQTDPNDEAKANQANASAQLSQAKATAELSKAETEKLKAIGDLYK